MTEETNTQTEITESEQEQVNNSETTPNAEEKAFSQTDLDKVIAQRLKRERQKWASELEEEKAKAAMTETEKLKVEKLEAEKKAQDILSLANQRVLSAEAKILATNAGVKPEKLAHLLKLLDLSEIEIDESGTPDSKQIKTAIDSVLKDIPEFVNTNTTSKAGSEFNTTNTTDPSQMTQEQLAKYYGIPYRP